jgi:hypothetical protein
MSSAPPTTPTDEIYPVWTDLVNNWRAVDAHWIRDRLVQVFDDATERTSVLGASARQGMLSYLKGTDSLEFRKASAWESVRYPNLAVTSDATTVNLRRTGAGSGLTLKSDGSTEITTLFAGTGGLGSLLDSTGLSIKVGAKTVKFITDSTQLLVDSPVKVTGDVEATAALKGASAALTGNLTAVNATLTGTLTGTGATMTGTVSVGILRSGNAEFTTDTTLAVFRNLVSPTNRLAFSTTGAATLIGSTVAITGATTFANKITGSAGIDLLASASNITGPSMTNAPVAGVIAMNRAPTGSDVYPDNTIWFQI